MERRVTKIVNPRSHGTDETRNKHGDPRLAQTYYNTRPSDGAAPALIHKLTSSLNPALKLGSLLHGAIESHVVAFLPN
jgi:hypothetical protein